MSKLILKNAKTIEKLLLMLGFVKKRQKGSHIFFQHHLHHLFLFPFRFVFNFGRQIQHGFINIRVEPEHFD